MGLIATFSMSDTQHYITQHAECRIYLFAKCRYDHCRGANNLIGIFFIFYF